MPTPQGTVGAGGASTNRTRQARYSVTVHRLFAELRYALSATATIGLLSLPILSLGEHLTTTYFNPRLVSG